MDDTGSYFLPIKYGRQPIELKKGMFTILCKDVVDLNPEWNPPKSEEWAEDEKVQAPGSPDNPMGRARLVYRMPNTVHGTEDSQSLGKASSHGSIRVANDVVLQLAELLLKAGGSWEGPKWFQQMTENRTEEHQVPLEQRIPIKVQE